MEKEIAKTSAISKVLRVAVWCLAITAPAVYLFYLLRYSINVPYWDDFDVILGNLAWHHSGLTIRQHLETIFLMHGNEHLTATLQLYALGENALLGEVNFRHMILLGNFCLFLFAFFLLKDSTRPGQRVVFFLPVLPLLFHFHYFEASYWGTVALQIFPAVLLAWLSMHFLLKGSNKGLWLAMLFSLFTLQTFGSGIVLLGIMALVLLMHRRWKHLVFFGVFMALMFLMFFIRFPEMPHSGSKMDAILVHPLQTLHFLLTLAGTGIPVNRDFYWIPGGVLALWFVWLTVRRYWRTNAIVYFFLLFIWLVIAAGAVSRAGGGIGEAFASRYAFNGALLLVFSWIGCLDLIKQKWRPVVTALGLPLALLVSGMHLQANLPDVKSDFENKIESIKRYSPTGESLLYSVAEGAAHKMNMAVEQGFYNAPAVSPDLWTKPEHKKVITKEDTTLNVWLSDNRVLVYSLEINGIVETKDEFLVPDSVFVWLRNENQAFRIKTVLQRPQNMDLDMKYSFQCLADHRKLDHLIYDVGVEVKGTDGKSVFKWISHHIVLGNLMFGGGLLPLSLTVDSAAGKTILNGRIQNDFKEKGIYLHFISQDADFVFPVIPASQKNNHAFICLPEGGLQILWLRGEGVFKVPENNYTAAFTVSPDPLCLLDSLAEIKPSPDNAGQKVCYTSFYDFPGTNTLSISVAADGIVLRYEDGEYYEILSYHSMPVPLRSRIMLVMENNTPSLYFNDSLLFRSVKPLPVIHPCEPNFGRNSENGFSGELDDLCIWSKALRPGSDGSFPDEEAAIFGEINFDSVEDGQTKVAGNSQRLGWEFYLPYSAHPSGFSFRIPDGMEPGRYSVSIVTTRPDGEVLYISPSEMMVEVK